MPENEHIKEKKDENIVDVGLNMMMSCLPKKFVFLLAVCV